MWCKLIIDAHDENGSMNQRANEMFETSSNVMRLFMPGHHELNFVRQRAMQDERTSRTKMLMTRMRGAERRRRKKREKTMRRSERKMMKEMSRMMNGKRRKKKHDAKGWTGQMHHRHQWLTTMEEEALV